MTDQNGTLSELGFQPDWPAPATVGSFITFRTGGFSEGAYASNNLAMHVGDNPETVTRNRRKLVKALDLAQQPYWLNQVHGTQIISAETSLPEPAPTGLGDKAPEADGSYTFSTGKACVVLTADCLPILLCDKEGTRVAAVHGGWRGLADNIISRAIEALQLPGSEIMAYLGPAISATVYEVGPDVANAFSSLNADRSTYVQPNSQRSGHYFLDLYTVARLQLQKHKVNAIYGGDHCSFRERRHFYSYRRDGETGRMASLIWLRQTEQELE